MFLLSKWVVLTVLMYLGAIISSTANAAEPAIHLPHNPVLANGEMHIGCDTVGVETFVLMSDLTADGELCRPERFQEDLVFLEATLYSPETVGYPTIFVAPWRTKVVAQSLPDTFACADREDIERYLHGGLSEIVGDCKPMLWADVAEWKLDDPLESMYCADLLGVESMSVAVYKVQVASRARWAITDCLDEHMADSAFWGDDPKEDVAPTQDRPIILAEANK